MVKFVETSPLDLSRDAHNFLALAAIRSDEDFSDVVEKVQRKEGTFYEVMDNKIVGAVYLVRYPFTLYVGLLGGNNLSSWKKDLIQFLKDTMKTEGVDHLCVCGRTGWGRLFDELKPVGMLYSHNAI